MNCYYSLIKGNTQAHLTYVHTAHMHTHTHTHTCTHTCTHTHTHTHAHTHAHHAHTHHAHTHHAYIHHTTHTTHTPHTHTTHTHSPYTIVHTCTSTPPDVRLHNHIPWLFELISMMGEFVASEVLYPARNNDPEAFPFLQSDTLKIFRVELCTELFYAIIPTLYLCFLLICYPYIPLHF